MSERFEDRLRHMLFLTPADRSGLADLVEAARELKEARQKQVDRDYWSGRHIPLIDEESLLFIRLESLVGEFARSLNRLRHQNSELLAKEEGRLVEEMYLRCIWKGRPGILIGRFVEGSWLEEKGC